MSVPGLLGGRYELRDILGYGGMAEVRSGWDTRLNRAVAIKLLHAGPNSQADVRERFKVEARAAAALNHPNIVNVYDYGDDDGTPFIVMERLPGDTLADQIALGPLPQSDVRMTLLGVLAALAAAHAAGMLHRDIKPGNILLTPPAGVKVADFGIVKTAGSVHTTTGQIVGTLAYLSPDRIAGEPAAVSDDLYAVGVVGYEALTGRKPFLQEEIVPLARAIADEDPPPLLQLRPDVDRGLAEAIGRAMSKDPLRRFRGADDMRAALGAGFAQPAMAGLGPVNPPQRRPPTRVLTMHPGQSSAHFGVPAAPPRRRSTRPRTVVGVVAAVAALAVAVLAFALDPSTTRGPTAPVSVSTSPSVAATPSSVDPPPPTATPVVEPADTGNGKGPNGNGHGRGNGNGHGNKGPK